MSRRMAEQNFRSEQWDRRFDPNVEPINRFVDELREDGRAVPYVAPMHGGINARLLYVLRDPGPMAIEGGFLSTENNDVTAETLCNLFVAAEIDAGDIVPWNAYPWFINRDPNASELNAGVAPLKRVIDLLPNLRVVMLLGRSAQDGWRRLTRQYPNFVSEKKLHVIETYHTSPQAFWHQDPAVRESRRKHLSDRFQEAANHLHSLEQFNDEMSLPSETSDRETQATERQISSISDFHQMLRRIFPDEKLPDPDHWDDETISKLISVHENQPLAFDGKRYSMELRYLSLFTWGRPPLPPKAADFLASVTDQHKIHSVFVLGSCCPSVLASIGFGDARRVIRMLDMQGRWSAGYYNFLEDAYDVSKYPEPNNWLPNNNIQIMSEWSLSPNLGEMVFIDQPVRNPSPSRNLDLNAIILKGIKPRLIVIGFSGDLPGPSDLEENLKNANWLISEQQFEQTNCETGAINTYRMLVAISPDVASYYNNSTGLPAFLRRFPD